MPAAITDKLRKASSGSRPVAATLAADKANGATTATISVATGWNTTTAVDVVIYRTDTSGNIVPGTQTDWVALLSGTTLSAMVLKAGTEPSTGYPAGAQSVVMCTPTAAWADDLIVALLVEHLQDGTHDPAKVAMLAGAQTFSGQKTFSVAPVLPTDAVTLGYAEITSNFTTTTVTTPVDVTSLTTTFTVPAGGRRTKVTLWLPQVSSTAVAATGLTAYIREGSTTLASLPWTMPGSQYGLPATVLYPKPLSAGSHTLKASVSQSAAGTLTVSASSTSTPFILVELI